MQIEFSCNFVLDKFTRTRALGNFSLASDKLVLHLHRCILYVQGQKVVKKMLRCFLSSRTRKADCIADDSFSFNDSYARRHCLAISRPFVP